MSAKVRDGPELQQGARNLIQVSHMGVWDQRLEASLLFSKVYFSRNLESGAKIMVWNPDIPEREAGVFTLP